MAAENKNRRIASAVECLKGRHEFCRTTAGETGVQQHAGGDPYYDLCHLARPGMTGWVHFMRPHGASVEDVVRKLRFDLYYIENYSLVLDLFIVLRTTKVVLPRSGQ